MLGFFDSIELIMVPFAMLVLLSLDLGDDHDGNEF